MEKERRKYIRYQLENAVTIDPNGVYQLEDISEGGFRFKCHPHTFLPEKWKTDIINSIVSLDEIPARKVWISLRENGEYDLPALMVVGAKFRNLKEEQKKKLKDLLQSLSQRQMRKDK